MTSITDKCGRTIAADDFNQRGTAYNPMKWTAIVCTALTGVILLILKINHFRSYTRPKEQRQITRMLIAPSVWALVSMGQILDYRVAAYLLPIGDTYESIYLCSVFLLFIQFTAPDAEFDGEMFRTVSEADEGEPQPLEVDWPRLAWIFVFQFPILQALSSIIIEATQAGGVYCPNSMSPQFGNIWATIIQSVSLGAAVTSILKFFQHLKKRLGARRGLAKLIGFKAIVGVMWIQQLAFGILQDHNVLKPSKTFSYVDFLYGLPAAVTCVEMVFFALWFWYVCSASEYHALKQTTRPYPVWKAVVDSFNYYDILLGIGHIFTVALYMHRSGGFKTWNEARAARKQAAYSKGKGGSIQMLFSAGKRAIDRNHNSYAGREFHTIVSTDSIEMLRPPTESQNTQDNHRGLSDVEP